MAGRMELVIGGSGSGKSAYSESAAAEMHRALCTETGTEIPFYYIADMIPHGAETEEKIRKHREMRKDRGFQTLEWYVNLEEKIRKEEIPEGSCALLECVSNLTANEMYESDGAREDAAGAVIRGIHLLRERCASLTVVTNDVFCEAGTDSAEMDAYKRTLGQINRELAEEADAVTEVVFGVPVRRKPEEKRQDKPQKEWRKNLQENLQGKRQDEPQKEWREEQEGRSVRTMTVITGGAYQGKRRFAEQISPGLCWADGTDCPLEEIEQCGAVDHFHLFVRRWLSSGRTAEELVNTILEKNRGITVVCCEIGCGLVPVDAFERRCREETGRICTELAEKAEHVYRVVCGIGQQLK